MPPELFFADPVKDPEMSIINKVSIGAPVIIGKDISFDSQGGKT
jgi:hypothetical protein